MPEKLSTKTKLLIVFGGSGLLLVIGAILGADLSQPKKPAADSSTNHSVVSASPTPTSTQTAKDSCGDSGIADNWYPVFIDNGNLSEIRSRFCKDAIAKTREKTGKPTVQLASFSDRGRAESFAQSVGGEVGEPYSVAAQEKPVEKATPSTPEPQESKPQTAEDRFVQTLANRTKSASAHDGVVVIGYRIYNRRSLFWYQQVRNSDSVVSSVSKVHLLVKGVAIKEGYPWDYFTIEDMSEAIVGGMYQWEHDNPGDLNRD